MLRILVLVLIATGLHAAVTIDLDLAQLRTMPEAASLRERLDALLPAQATMRLEAMEALFGFDPRRDQTRVVITVPDAGVGGATVRLFGLPAERIAAMLSLRGDSVALPGGRTGHALPNRPHAVFVAIGPAEALIGRGDALAALAALPPTPSPSGTAIAVHAVPGAHPRLAFMTLVSAINLRANGLGHVTATVTATDEAAAIELQRRFGVIGDMVRIGAEGKLPRAIDAKELFAATTVTRSGATLAAVIEVPTDLRAHAIDRLIERLGSRQHPVAR